MKYMHVVGYAASDQSEVATREVVASKREFPVFLFTHHNHWESS